MLSDDDLQKLYAWIDEIPLSRPKRNISRDFADCVLVAEVIAHYFPKMVQLHNYSAANSTPQKMYNWITLNQKVLAKLGYTLSKTEIEQIVISKPGSVEIFLHQLQFKMARFRAAGGSGSGSVGGNRAQVRRMPPQAQPQPQSQPGPGPGYFSTNEREVMPNPPPQQQQQQPQQQQQYQQPQHQQHQQHHQHQQQQEPRTMPPAHLQNAEGDSYNREALQREVDEEILLEKEQTILDLRETVEILELKVAKLEQLVRLKDAKIVKLQGLSSS